MYGCEIGNMATLSNGHPSSDHDLTHKNSSANPKLTCSVNKFPSRSVSQAAPSRVNTRITYDLLEVGLNLPLRSIINPLSTFKTRSPF